MNQVTNRLNAGFNKLLNLGGNQISIQYFSVYNTGVYDDDVTITQSGNTLWTSGLVFPVNAQSDDAVLMEQGKIGLNDNKIYVNGSLILISNTNNMQVKIGIGSPNTDTYSLIMPGTDAYSNENTPVYKCMYVRRLTGSLVGEND
jgi:hypothetical protein